MNVFNICKRFTQLNLSAMQNGVANKSTLFNNTFNNIMSRSIVSTNPSSIGLNNLRDNPGANKKKVRVGRGIGSGRGKTSTRGHGGQSARAGHNIPRGFEGGQTPLYKKMRKYGFSNVAFSRVYNTINLFTLDRLIREGKVDATQTITMKHLYDLRVVDQITHGVKLLGQGSNYFSHKIDIELSDFSTSAKEAIEKLGGSAKNVYYDRVGLRYLLKPYKFDFVPKRARVPLKLRDKYPNHPTGYLGAYSTDVDVVQEESN
ncbi:hypothetical protein CYY_001756 [Polysphondylium violaceum]|uniref:Large ribosomal subunit protein uL15/eL18 domain-containing protein n=1 Tax=Polysphondylium violaceum TaxID=133409 RepID=A0A8J4V3L5_9MYCE|nr:hypothetical protein CYY_001756 [Polysphondylium violaceum]